MKDVLLILDDLMLVTMDLAYGNKKLPQVKINSSLTLSLTIKVIKEICIPFFIIERLINKYFLKLLKICMASLIIIWCFTMT